MTAEISDISDISESSDNERVFRHLRRAIIEGHYAPGERIVEARVADALSVSRTPVREAVRRLESEGLVTTERNRGAHVRMLTNDGIADLYEARARLESFLAELAARRASPADIEAIRATADNFDATLDGLFDQSGGTTVVGLRAVLRANDRFHASLVHAGHADQLHSLLLGTVDMPLVFRAFGSYSASDMARSSLFHHLIADAVAAGEPERAGRLMTEHVLQGRDQLLSQFPDSKEHIEHG